MNRSKTFFILMVVALFLVGVTSTQCSRTHLKSEGRERGRALPAKPYPMGSCNY